MRHLKSMLVVFAVVVSTALYANPEKAPFEAGSNKTSISYEIEILLRNSQLVIEEDFTATIIFEVTRDNRVNIRTIKSPNEEVNKFLEKRLQDHKLKGDGWFTEKIYELPVKVRGNA